MIFIYFINYNHTRYHTNIHPLDDFNPLLISILEDLDIVKSHQSLPYIIYKNALIANRFSYEYTTMLAKRFSTNNASEEKAIAKMNGYLIYFFNSNMTYF